MGEDNVTSIEDQYFCKNEEPTRRGKRNAGTKNRKVGSLGDPVG
jgi:hypothetical protein